MTKKSSWLWLALTGFAALSCGGADDEDSFEVPSNAPEIGDTGLYLSSAVPAAKPTPTQGSNAPRITGVSATRTGSHSFSVRLEVEANVTIGYAYLDFGTNGVFKAPTTAVAAVASSSDAPITACGAAARQQGITCTSACLSACSCLSCADKQVELNTEQACALTCTIADQVGTLEEEPYDGDEDKFASLLYKGDPSLGVPGVASQLGCATATCAAVSLSPTPPRKSYAIEFETPTVPELTPMFAPQVASNDAAAVSEPFAPAKVKICPQGVMACR